MKRLITLILALVLILAMSPAVRADIIYIPQDRFLEEHMTGAEPEYDGVFCGSDHLAYHTCEKLRELGADFLVLEKDISRESEVLEIFDAVLERYGRVDILVNNAATDDENGLDTIEKITRNVIDDTFAVNVRGSLLMTRDFIRHRGDYGRIINLSTDAAQIFAGQITYGASKATLEALTRSIALEVAPYGITVNCVAPGPTQTGWIDEEFEKVVVPLIPMAQLIQPEDIAQTILFLASQQARMLTGQVIKVSGGHAL